jgi:cell wall-associated NlpC family hydrolase
MSWPGYRSATPARDLVGRAAVLGAAPIAGAAVLLALVVVFGPVAEDLRSVHGSAAPSSSVPAGRAEALTQGADQDGPPGSDAADPTDSAASDWAPGGEPPAPAAPTGSGAGGPTGAGPDAGTGAGAGADDSAGADTGERGETGPRVCTWEITDLSQLHAAMVNSGPDEIICVRGPQVLPAARAAVAFARSQLGQPYRWAGNGAADGGFDCSGLTSASYAAAGIPIPRTAQAQFNAGPRLPSGQQIQPGDLVFFSSGPAEVGHVGLAISSTKMINAPDLGQVVTIGPIRRRDFVGATRPVAGSPVRRTG